MDLHIHVPGTALNDNYRKTRGEDILDTFCQIIEESDVDIIGLTDYFKLDRVEKVISHHRSKYPNSPKLLLRVLEVRLNESVNRDQEEVNLHLVISPRVSVEAGENFLRNLDTETTNEASVKQNCFDLDRNSCDSAVITRSSISKAIERTFGFKLPQQDFVLTVTSGKGDGIRPVRGKKRKAALVDEIDKISDAFFGNQNNREYYLQSDRLEGKDNFIAPKPTFGGSDAHSFEELAEKLGKTGDGDGNAFDVTWVKCDASYEGLRQTLVEPEGRSRIQDEKPEPREEFHWISRVNFSSPEHFPESIHFNPHLVSIIGSRSSGKSALLAYMSYAVDRDYTIAQQTQAQGLSSKDVGPAASLKWSDPAVRAAGCEVVWGNGTVGGGRVIYIPQNSLYSISDSPGLVTEKIRTALVGISRSYESMENQYKVAEALFKASVSTIVRRWAEARAAVDSLYGEIRSLGSSASLESALKDLQSEIDAEGLEGGLSQAEIDELETVNMELRGIDVASELLQSERENLLNYVSTGVIGKADLVPQPVVVAITPSPSTSALPDSVRPKVTRLIDNAGAVLERGISDVLRLRLGSVVEELDDLFMRREKICSDNSSLLSSQESLVRLGDMRRRYGVLDAQKQRIDKLQISADEKLALTAEIVEELDRAVAAREAAQEILRQSFVASELHTQELSFGIEFGFDEDALSGVSHSINRIERSRFLSDDRTHVDLDSVAADRGGFLDALRSGEQKIRQGKAWEDVGVEVLSVLKEVRYSATLDGDTIGGFTTSSMTPGKQALFALNLILCESEDPWPLLIDQPEDDLDSRSIFGTIVPYLLKSKGRRQIIMVSHNANLVVGADSEQIVVANRHGDDRPNRAGRSFDYLTGSLEDARRLGTAGFPLESRSVEGHVCELLDGGKQAFKKRMERYKV